MEQNKVFKTTESNREARKRCYYKNYEKNKEKGRVQRLENYHMNKENHILRSRAYYYTSRNRWVEAAAVYLEAGKPIPEKISKMTTGGSTPTESVE